MKKKIIPLFVLLGTIGAYAQTGIGKALPSQSAELEVFSNNKGMLIPRLALKGEEDKTTIVGGGNYPESLLVFNIGTVLEPGFYYWSSNKWNALVSNSTLYKYIKETAKDGNVTITKNDTGDDFTFTWVDKSTGETKTFTLGELVKKMETLTVLSGANTDNKALLVYKDEDEKNNTVDLTEILKNSTVFQDYLKQYINSVNPDQVTTEITTSNTAEGKRTGIYEYYNELRNDAAYVPFKIDVSSDVVDNFEKIINDGDVKNVLNKFFTTNPPAGTVTYTTNQAGDHIFKYIDESGVAHDLNMSDIVKQYETETVVTPLEENGKRTGVYEYYNEKKGTTGYLPVQITVVADVKNNFEEIINDGDVKNVLNKFFTTNPPAGTVTYTTNQAGDHIFKYIDENGTAHDLNMSDIVKQYETLTAVERYNNAGTVANISVKPTDGFIFYEYNDEKGGKRYISVSKDVSNDFSKIINDGNNKTLIENIVTATGGNASISKNASDDVIITDVTKDPAVEYNITELIKANGAIAKLGLTNDSNTNNVKGIFTFNDGKEGSTDVKFAETLTAIEKGTDANNAKLIAYNYKDETGANATAQITVSADVIHDFQEIINTPSVDTILKTYISGTTGSVTVSKDANGDVIIGYKDGAEAAQTVNLTTEIKAKETLTAVERYNNAGTVENITAKPNDGFIFYEYNDEDEGKRYISVSKDVSNDFSKIINDGNNKTLIENIVKTTGGNASISKDATSGDVIITDVNGTAPDNVYNITEMINANKGTVAELTLQDGTVNADAVKAGFTFKADKTATEEVNFAETLTKISLIDYKVYVYKEFNQTTGKEEYTYVEGSKLPDDQLGDKVLYSDYEVKKMVYENEKGDLVEVKGSDLLRKVDPAQDPSGNGQETITSLNFIEDYKGIGPCLVYLDEEKKESYIMMSDMFKFSETITTLNFDKDNRQITYKNEAGQLATFTFDDVIQEPWYVAKASDNDLPKQATSNTEDIYTQGWVGIGYDKKSAAPNEKLRVNGSITATNSYYADYVFENYFEGYSSLKYDYSFKDLSSVSDFIEENRHLPGITPISNLEKTETGYSFNVSELSIQLLEKTEELFLHTIEQQKELEAKSVRIDKLESEMSDMAKRLEALEALLTK